MLKTLQSFYCELKNVNVRAVNKSTVLYIPFMWKTLLRMSLLAGWNVSYNVLNVWFAQGNLLASEALAKKKKKNVSLSLALRLPLEMIRAFGAAWNHYWCTLMKSHLFEVQALCLSSHVHARHVRERACIHLSVPVCEISLSFSFSLSQALHH